MGQAVVTLPPAIPLVPSNIGDTRASIARVTVALNQVLRGAIAATLGVTLVANDTASTFSDSRIGPFTFIALMPASANAVAALPSIWFEPTKGSVTIHHANSPNTDQTFVACLLG